MAAPDNLPARQRGILQDLKERGFVSTTDLAAKYNVSDMTIRRDARHLAASGVARSVRGGLMLPHGTMHGPGFVVRANEDGEAKRRIAAACVRTISSEERVFIDAGTTAYGIARALPETFRGTILTHSVPVMQAALHLPNATTIGLGGELLHDSQAFVGSMSIANLESLRAETAFLGVAALDDTSLYIERSLEFETKRAITAAADRIVVVAARAKVGRSDLVRLGDLAEADLLVTDEDPPAHIAQALRDAGVAVSCAR